MNLGGARICCVAQSKMQSAVVRTDIAPAGENVAALAYSICLQIHRRAGSISRTSRAAHKLQLDPMVMIGIYVPQQRRGPVDRIDDDVDFAIIEQVAKSRASPGKHIGKSGAF